MSGYWLIIYCYGVCWGQFDSDGLGVCDYLVVLVGCLFVQDGFYLQWQQVVGE